MYELHKLRPLSIGLEDFFDFANTLLAETNIKFPPYNTSKVGENTYQIEMALAGYKKEDIEITMHDGVLTVKSVKRVEPEDDSKVLYKGISNRSFSRSFTLADNVVVNNASMEDGMLRIELEQIVPEAKKLKTIAIK